MILTAGQEFDLGDLFICSKKSVQNSARFWIDNDNLSFTVASGYMDAAFVNVYGCHSLLHGYFVDEHSLVLGQVPVSYQIL